MTPTDIIPEEAPASAEASMSLAGRMAVAVMLGLFQVFVLVLVALFGGEPLNDLRTPSPGGIGTALFLVAVVGVALGGFATWLGWFWSIVAFDIDDLNQDPTYRQLTRNGQWWMLASNLLLVAMAGLIGMHIVHDDFDAEYNEPILSGLTTWQHIAILGLTGLCGWLYYKGASSFRQAARRGLTKI